MAPAPQLKKESQFNNLKVALIEKTFKERLNIYFKLIIQKLSNFCFLVFFISFVSTIFSIIFDSFFLPIETGNKLHGGNTNELDKAYVNSLIYNLVAFLISVKEFVESLIKVICNILPCLVGVNLGKALLNLSKSFPPTGKAAIDLGFAFFSTLALFV